MKIWVVEEYGCGYFDYELYNNKNSAFKHLRKEANNEKLKEDNVKLDFGYRTWYGNVKMFERNIK